MHILRLVIGNIASRFPAPDHCTQHIVAVLRCHDKIRRSVRAARRSRAVCKVAYYDLIKYNLCVKLNTKPC